MNKPIIPPVPPKGTQPLQSGQPLPPSLDLAGADENGADAQSAPWLIICSFLLFVLGPVGLTAWYLLDYAADRYASRAAFSVRASESSAPVEIFGAITQLGGGGTASDAQILYDFIQSQQIVERIRAKIFVEQRYSKAPKDLIFHLPVNRPIEDLLDHWADMTDVALDPSTGLLSIEARAFTPEDARDIASAILSESIDLVNRLSEGARAELVRATAAELELAEEQLRAIRTRLRMFRNVEQEVDPTANARVALELVATLEEERAKAQVRLAELTDVLSQDAPQIQTLQRRIQTLDERIGEHRLKLGRGGTDSVGDDRALSDIVGDYEELVVDREFAEQAYTLALAAHQQALAEAHRRHRHLAVHIAPTLSEEAEYPDKPLWILTVALFFLCLWSVASLIISNVRERR